MSPPTEDSCSFIVFDLDGTLADCSHRVPLLPNWDAFYSACDEDSPISPIISVYRELCKTHLVEIWTGRRDSEEDKTLAWFEKHDIPLPSGYRMRPDGDHRPDKKLKSQWLNEAHCLPSLVFEDRSSVVNMYRDRGIQVCQVAPGDF